MKMSFDRLTFGRNTSEYLYRDSKAYLMQKGDTNIKFESLLEDACFNEFINQLKKDGEDIDNKNEIAKLSKNPEDVAKREAFKGSDNRKEVPEIGNERDIEYQIYKMYKNNSHKDLGICKLYQSPTDREYERRRAIDLVFNNGNDVYICELKSKKESIFRAISEILTYYYCVDKSRNEFLEKFGGNIDGDIIPCIIIPNIMVKDIIGYSDILKAKLKNKGVLFEIFSYSSIDNIGKL